MGRGRGRKGRGAGGARGAAEDGGGVEPLAARPTIFLATDSMDVVEEAMRYTAEFRVIHLKEGLVNRHSLLKGGKPLLWDRRRGASRSAGKPPSTGRHQSLSHPRAPAV